MTIQNQGCRNSEPIARHFALFSTLVLLPIYFVYSLLHWEFTTFITQCPALLAVPTPLIISLS